MTTRGIQCDHKKHPHSHAKQTKESCLMHRSNLEEERQNKDNQREQPRASKMTPHDHLNGEVTTEATTRN
jgi:hypothetical protein